MALETKKNQVKLLVLSFMIFSQRQITFLEGGVDEAVHGGRHVSTKVRHRSSSLQLRGRLGTGDRKLSATSSSAATGDASDAQKSVIILL